MYFLLEACAGRASALRRGPKRKVSSFQDSAGSFHTSCYASLDTITNQPRLCMQDT